MATKYPGVFDALDLVLLRLAKLKREKFEDDAEFYNKFFVEYDVEKYVHDVRNKWRYSIWRRLFDEIFPGACLNVADIGCGLGISLLYLPESVDFIGVDLSAQTLNLARHIHRNKGDIFRKGGFPNLPIKSRTVDFCLCFEVIEHLSDDDRALVELRRILKPGGYLLISVPRTYYWDDYKRLIGHFRHYDGGDFSRMLKENNFIIEKQISQFTRFWQCYHYIYILFRMVEILVQKVLSSNYCVYKSWLYRKMTECILRCLEHRYCDSDVQSTFILCRKQYKGEDVLR